MQDAKKRRTTWRWLGMVLSAAALIYLATILFKSGLQFRQLDWKQYLLPILISLAIYLFSLVIQFIVWARMISFHRKVNWQDVQIYSRMILMRRLPSGAWHWVGRTALYSSTTELPVRVSIVGSLLEWFLLILVGAGLFFAVLETLGVAYRLLCVLVAIGTALAITFSWQPKDRPWFLRLVEGCFWIFLYGAAWICGLSIFMLFVHTAGAGQMGWLEALRVWTIAAGIGVLTVILPFTLGIQEVTLVWLLRPWVSQPIALLVALMIRLVYILADAIWGILGWILSRFVLRSRSQVRISGP